MLFIRKMFKENATEHRNEQITEERSNVKQPWQRASKITRVPVPYNSECGKDKRKQDRSVGRDVRNQLPQW